MPTSAAQPAPTTLHLTRHIPYRYTTPTAVTTRTNARTVTTWNWKAA